MPPSEAPPQEPAQTAPPPQSGPPWGLWATIGFTVLVLVAIVAVQTGVVLVFFAGLHAQEPQLALEELQNRIATNGTATAAAALASVPVAVGLVWLLVWLRRGSCVHDYLCLRLPDTRTLVFSAVGVLGLIALTDYITHALGRPISPPVVVEIYRNTSVPWLLWLALVVAAPLTEETVFRGFLFRGLEASRAGPVGATLLSASLWAIMHIQYEPYGMLVILIFGIGLGVVRWRWRSLYLCIMLHGLMNIVATAEAHYFAQT